MLLHANMNQGYRVLCGGVGVLCQGRRTLFVAEAEVKRGVGANCEEV